MRQSLQLLVLAVLAAAASPGAGGQGRPDVVWLAGGHGLTVYRAAYSRNGSTAVTVSYDFSAKLWRTSDGALLGSVADRPDMPASVAVAPDGSLMAVAYGSSDATPGQVRIIRASDGATVQRMSIHPYGVSSVAFSPDGSTFATTGGDKALRFWRTTDWTLERTVTGLAATGLHAGRLDAALQLPRWNPRLPAGLRRDCGTLARAIEDGAFEV